MSREAQSHRRNSSTDALLGGVRALEAVVAALLRERAQSPEALMRLRREVERQLASVPEVNRYGFGREEIADGEQDTLDALFGRPEEF